MSNVLVIPPNIGQTAGPIVLGYMLNWALFGVLSVQVYLYYMSFPNDRKVIKALVYGIYIFDAVQTALITHDAFAIFAFGWGNLSQLQSAHWSWFHTPIMSGIVSCVVQIFYAYRIFVLSHSRVLGCAIGTVSITQATAAIIGGVQVSLADSYTKIQQVSHVSTTIWLAGSVLCDISIAACMVYHLSRKNTQFRETQVLINKLVRLTIETGTLTATVATIELALFLALPSSTYHTTPANIIAKLYSNSLVMTFNARSRIVGGRDNTQSGELLELRTTKRITPGGTTSSAGMAPIHITTTQHQISDNTDKLTLGV